VIAGLDRTPAIREHERRGRVLEGASSGLGDDRHAAGVRPCGRPA
jgi:hypothetical protein